ncbi:hypothetical protein TVAGG3_0417710 [Trichomonas vaginalis G3]|uniref:hypothetical protein n=1 Tax=Trichomonas vaginalis (strain ATCC PRA-98 / G3) TaxID=412133 RepID=UPI0021E5C832|nr:hypothetical protein TVAGG3_0417710 [Trichomonas vaginalis G3]KAI5535815.1 hypothetical protein TVAGG3_0417710 [Trichomonas vaginalis G3]
MPVTYHLDRGNIDMKVSSVENFLTPQEMRKLLTGKVQYCSDCTLPVTYISTEHIRYESFLCRETFLTTHEDVE